MCVPGSHLHRRTCHFVLQRVHTEVDVGKNNGSPGRLFKVVCITQTTSGNSSDACCPDEVVGLGGGVLATAAVETPRPRICRNI
jgi:hypothetical protein